MLSSKNITCLFTPGKNIFFLTAFIAVFFLTSCQRRPQAGFTTNQDGYTKGDDVLITNTSANADSYKLTVNDVEYPVSSPVTIVKLTSDGECAISLTAYSRNRKQATTVVKVIQVQKANGSVLFYTSNANAGITSVTVDNYFAGKIYEPYSTEPDCEANGCVTLNLTEGEHTVDASSIMGLKSSFVITVKPNDCNKVKLFQ